jgi:hypothetical protein
LKGIFLFFAVASFLVMVSIPFYKEIKRNVGFVGELENKRNIVFINLERIWAKLDSSERDIFNFVQSGEGRIKNGKELYLVPNSKNISEWSSYTYPSFSRNQQYIEKGHNGKVEKILYKFSVVENLEDLPGFIGSSEGWNLLDGKLISDGIWDSKFLVDNPFENYEIQVNATLRELRWGGYGIFFETDETDTGYIFQFDVGFGSGELLVRKRENGKEDIRPVFRVKPKEAGIKTRNGQSWTEWWESEHNIRIKVVGKSKKTVSIYLDGHEITKGKLVIESTSNKAPSVMLSQSNLKARGKTGFRVWEGVVSQFGNLVVKKL